MNQHQLLTVRQTMRVIVECVLRKRDVATTYEIYRGVWAKHAKMRLLLPPRWQEVRQILETHCISHGGNSWFLEKLEPLKERPDGEQITNDSNRDQKRTDWANTESYRYLDLALPEYVPGDMVRKAVFGTFLSGLYRRLANWVYPRGHGSVWRSWQPRQAGSDAAERQGHAVGSGASIRALHLRSRTHH